MSSDLIHVDGGARREGSAPTIGHARESSPTAGTRPLPFDAPVPIDLSYVVHCYFDGKGCDSLIELLRRYATFRPTVLDRIQFVVVDDGSPVPIEIPEDIDLNILLLRIREDIPWNQPDARNLGILYARSDTVLAADLDYEFSEETLAYAADLGPVGRKMHLFPQPYVDGSWKHRHPNLFILSRGRFLELFGVDEDFAGAYACEDGFFRRWQKLHGTRFPYLKRKYAALERPVDRENEYHSLERDSTRNDAIKRRKLDELAIWGPRGGHSRAWLRFTWDLVEDRRRKKPTWSPPKNRAWRFFWPLRRVFRSVTP